jgi:hypothetical protein
MKSKESLFVKKSVFDENKSQITSLFKFKLDLNRSIFEKS